MRQWLRSHLTYANVISTLALFLVVGGGTTLAATGGNFILGQSNSANSTTSLTRTGANTGKGLQVTNLDAGAGATALGLNVASGHPPFTVNSGTKVTNLNADKLDGIDSTGFIRGRKLNVVLDRPSTGNGTLTKIATVGPYDINGRCDTDDFGVTTQVRISAKGPAGISEAVWSAVRNDATDLGNDSFAPALPANVDTAFAIASEGGDNYTRIGGTAVLRSNSGVMVQVNFTALAWAGDTSCHIFGTAMMAT